jgi:hypothetical protein
LSGHFKDRLQGIEFIEKDYLPGEIREILNGVSGKALKVVFIEWEKRLQAYIDAGADYIE